MAESQKEQKAQKTVQLIKRELGINPTQALVLTEWIRSACKENIADIEYYVKKPTKDLPFHKQGMRGLIELLKFKVPQPALTWLSYLSWEQRAKLRIATNATLDELYNGKDWTLIAEGGCVLSNTILVYPRSGQTMPGLVESAYHDRKCLVYTKEFQGESNIAIAFDEYSVSMVRDRSGNRVITYTPVGQVSVIRQFPSKSDWLVLRDGCEILGPVGTGRYIRRTEEQWVGPIVRSHALARELVTGLDERHAKAIIYACPTRKDMFGLVLEAPVISRDAEVRPEKQMPLLDRPAPVQQPDPKRVFDAKEVLDLMEVLGNRTLFYIQNPEMLKVAFHPAEEVSARYALIGQIDRKSEGTIREIARSTVFLTYLNTSPEFTAERFALTFWKLCDALGVQNELSSAWKRN